MVFTTPPNALTECPYDPRTLFVKPTRGASDTQRQAVALGAFILDEDDHDATMEELERRYLEDA